MTPDDAKHLLAPLARDDGGRAAPGDVSAWVMRDVRAIAVARRTKPGVDDATIWRWAAGLAGAMAAVVVVVATLQLTATSDENPLVDFASTASVMLEAQ